MPNTISSPTASPAALLAKKRPAQASAERLIRSLCKTVERQLKADLDRQRYGGYRREMAPPVLTAQDRALAKRYVTARKGMHQAEDALKQRKLSVNERGKLGWHGSILYEDNRVFSEKRREALRLLANTRDEALAKTAGQTAAEAAVAIKLLYNALTLLRPGTGR